MLFSIHEKEDWVLISLCFLLTVIYNLKEEIIFGNLAMTERKSWDCIEEKEALPIKMWECNFVIYNCLYLMFFQFYHLFVQTQRLFVEQAFFEPGMK